MCVYRKCRQSIVLKTLYNMTEATAAAYKTNYTRAPPPAVYGPGHGSSVVPVAYHPTTFSPVFVCCAHLFTYFYTVKNTTNDGYRHFCTVRRRGTRPPEVARVLFYSLLPPNPPPAHTHARIIGRRIPIIIEFKVKIKNRRNISRIVVATIDSFVQPRPGVRFFDGSFFVLKRRENVV